MNDLEGLITKIEDIPSLSDFFSFTENVICKTTYSVKSSFSKKSRSTQLSLILNLIDHTSLDGNDNDKKITSICEKVLTLEAFQEIPPIASVCIFPTFARLAKSYLEKKNIAVASVAGGFPSGQMPLDLKLKEVDWAIKQGATEIDTVISRGKLIEGNYQEVFDEITSIKKICKRENVLLKVIIESGELLTHKNIRLASDIAMYAGADFIKTSTGKIDRGATYDTVKIMLNAIKDFYNATGIKIGIKPSGGISSTKIAMDYLELTEQILGPSWLNNNLFRFGSSRLTHKVLNELAPLIKRPELVNCF